MLAITCLALNIYFEARNQPLVGQMMVAEVTLNRVISKKYPNTICGVVWQDKQFSWTHDGKSDKPRNKEAYNLALKVAEETLLYPTFEGGATHYHTVDSKPYWSRHLTKLGIIGDHIFYKEES